MNLSHRPALLLALSLVVSVSLRAQPPAQAPAPNPDGPYTVTLVPPVHGKVALAPALPADGNTPKAPLSP